MVAISLVVPLYINHPTLYAVVGRFFDSLHEHYPDLEVVGVDDASPLPHEYPVAFKHQTNLGFTATVNDGLKLAFSQGAEIVIIANDDLFIHEGDLDRFFDINPEDYVIASPMDTSASHDDRFGSIWGITKAAYDLLGLLDPRFKHFYSDREYYDRAKKAGVEIIKWYDITIEHPESATYKHVEKAKLLALDQKTFEQLAFDLGD